MSSNRFHGAFSRVLPRSSVGVHTRSSSTRAVLRTPKVSLLQPSACNIISKELYRTDKMNGCAPILYKGHEQFNEASYFCFCMSVSMAHFNTKIDASIANVPKRNAVNKSGFVLSRVDLHCHIIPIAMCFEHILSCCKA